MAQRIISVTCIDHGNMLLDTSHPKGQGGGGKWWNYLSQYSLHVNYLKVLKYESELNGRKLRGLIYFIKLSSHCVYEPPLWSSG
jgi:hypothetical protein